MVRPHQLAGGAPGGHALDRRVRRRRRDRGDVRLPLRPRDVDDAAAAEVEGAADRRRAARRVVVRLPRAAREAGGRRVVAGEPADGGAEAAAVVLVHRARRRPRAAVGARGGARRDRVPRDRQHAVGVALARLRPRALAVGVDDARLRRARRRDVDDVVEYETQHAPRAHQRGRLRRGRRARARALPVAPRPEERLAAAQVPALVLAAPVLDPLPLLALRLVEVRAAAQGVGPGRAPRRPLRRLPRPLPAEDFLLRDLAVGAADRHRRHRDAPERGDVSGRLAPQVRLRRGAVPLDPRRQALELVLVDPVGRCAPRQRLTATHTQLSHPMHLPVPQGWSGSSSTTSSRRCRATATRSSRPSSRPSPTRTTSTTA